MLILFLSQNTIGIIFLMYFVISDSCPDQKVKNSKDEEL